MERGGGRVPGKFRKPWILLSSMSPPPFLFPSEISFCSDFFWLSAFYFPHVTRTRKYRPPCIILPSVCGASEYKLKINSVPACFAREKGGGSEKTTFLASCTTCKMAIFLSSFVPETIVLFLHHIWTPFKNTCIAPPPFDMHPILDSRVKKRNNTTPPFPSSSKTQFPPNEIGHLPPFTSPR